METNVRTPNAIFGQPQRFLVPLFQRPYVWNEEQQWDPLWRDLERVALRLLANPHAKHAPHFLGAVVLQQVESRTGELQERMIIDGQQRLTTLQILLDALHAELARIGAEVPAGRLEYLIANDRRFCAREEDRYKVWPTNRDRPAFNEVMAAPPPVDHASLMNRGARMVDAHRFFSEQARDFLEAEGPEQHVNRAEAIERSVRDLLQIVVIDLAPDENAQEIFETLNARGAQLTAADLIKNFIFQKLQEKNADVEKAYEKHWKEFETAFWEAEVSAGRFRYQRSSLFINHWLISRTGEEVVGRQVFARFKTFAEHEAAVPMDVLLEQLSRAAAVYRKITEAPENTTGNMDRVGLFAYRTNAMDSDIMKSVLLALMDEERSGIRMPVIDSTLDVIESWLTRRMLVRATTKAYNQVAAELVGIVRQSEPSSVDLSVRSYLMSQTAEAKYWPDDEEVMTQLTSMPIYRKISRGRLRMVLEGLEDHLRGYCPGGKQYAGMRVPRDAYWIEHIMPQSWESSWPAPSRGSVDDRARAIHTLGNLTLLTSKLNTKVSNGPWIGDHGKKAALVQHDLLLLNRELDSYGKSDWSDDAIANRTAALIGKVLAIWPVPPGHKSSTIRANTPSAHTVDLPELISAGLIIPGQVIVPKSTKLRDRIGCILSDGRIDIGGQVFDTPSGAGYYVRKRSTNGWSFWLVDVATKKSLASIRREYLEKSSLASDVGEEEEDDDTTGDANESGGGPALQQIDSRQ